MNGEIRGPEDPLATLIISQPFVILLNSQLIKQDNKTP